jgi:probable poly-beta-1,6-N-acetyl-D-glucosamine export protein
MIRRLLQLNGISILGVILFHAAGWGFVAMYAWNARYAPITGPNYDSTGSVAYLVLRLMEQLAVFSIPAFLFVSGYFVAFATKRNQRTIGWNVIGARIKGLLIPYLIWSTLLFALAALQGQVYRPAQYAVGFLTGQANPAYYYVPLLIQFYLLAPLLAPLARNHPRALLIGAGLLQLTVQVLYYPTLFNLNVPAALTPYVDTFPKWVFPVRIFWFSLGMVAGFHLAELKALLARIKWLALATAVALIPLGMVEWETILQLSSQPFLAHRETLLDSVYSLAVLMAFLAFDKTILPAAKRLEDLGSKSFGIYLVHSPVMEFTARGLYHLAPLVLVYQILFQPLLILAGLGIPLLLMALVDRSPARKYYKYLFG